MRTSETIAAMAADYSAAQNAVKGAIKDAENPHLKSKYADLASVREACFDAFTSRGFSIIQSPQFIDGKTRVTTRILHKSGEWIEDDLDLIPVKNDPQGVGSAITYARRYSLSGFAGVAPEDDDGNEASGRTGSKQAQQEVAAAKIAAGKKQEAKPEPPKAAAPKIPFEVLNSFKGLKADLAAIGKQDTYYACLKRHKVEHSNEFASVDAARACFKDMKSVLDGLLKFAEQEKK